MLAPLQTGHPRPQNNEGCTYHVLSQPQTHSCAQAVNTHTNAQSHPPPPPSQPSAQAVLSCSAHTACTHRSSTALPHTPKLYFAHATQHVYSALHTSQMLVPIDHMLPFRAASKQSLESIESLQQKSRNIPTGAHFHITCRTIHILQA